LGKGFENLTPLQGMVLDIWDIYIFTPAYTKISLSQHSRTTFKPNFAYIFLSLRAVSKNTV